jgi:hypothetical protein
VVSSISGDCAGVVRGLPYGVVFGSPLTQRFRNAMAQKVQKVVRLSQNVAEASIDEKRGEVLLTLSNWYPDSARVCFRGNETWHWVDVAAE